MRESKGLSNPRGEMKVSITKADPWAVPGWGRGLRKDSLLVAASDPRRAGP